VFGVGGSGDSLPPTDLYFAQLTFGGGGGGLYGGGAGGRGVNGQDVCDGPGGGGSGLLATGSPTSTTTNTGDGFVTLTYQPTAVTTTTLSSAAGTVLLGGSVSYTATVAAGPTPISAGTVAFSDAGRTIPTCAAASLSAGGTATCTVTYPAVGSHPITATYSGAPGFAGSHAGLTQAVAYGQQVLSYSAASGRGGVLAIALRLTDVGGRNVSGPAIVVHAQDIDTTRSVGNPITSGGSNFPYVRAVNAYALLAIEPVALGKGTHILHFTAGADPTVHTITFTTH
jgi:hypothetical protein